MGGATHIVTIEYIWFSISEEAATQIKDFQDNKCSN